jgi:hypothetical protein
MGHREIIWAASLLPLSATRSDRQPRDVCRRGTAVRLFQIIVARPPTQDGLECFPEVATTMTDPAFAIKNEVQQLVDVQIDTLRKPALLTSSELDEYRSRSERITMLDRKLDLIVRKRFSFQSQTAA